MERLVHESVRTPGWSGRLMMFASTLFLISIFAYLGLAYGYRPYLSGQHDSLAAQAKTLSQQVQTQNQAQVVEFYSQLSNLRSILDKHMYASSLFGLLEKSVHPNVYFTHLSFNSANNQVTLNGMAKTAQDIPAQIQIFQAQPGVSRVAFNNLSAAGTGGQWQFDVVLTLAPDVLSNAGFLRDGNQAVQGTGSPAATVSASTTPTSTPTSSQP